MDRFEKWKERAQAVLDRGEGLSELNALREELSSIEEEGSALGIEDKALTKRL